MPWLRSRLSSDVLIMISQIALAGGAWRNYLGIQRPDRGYAATLLAAAFLFFAVTVGWPLLFRRSRESLPVKDEAPWLSLS
jgi:hypothetical protein